MSENSSTMNADQEITSLSEGARSWNNMLARTDQKLNEIQKEIDELAYELYDIGEEDQKVIETMLDQNSDDDGNVEGKEFKKPSDLVAELIDYAVGCAFGRWDIRCATGEKSEPPEPDPFDELPVCSPGMLQNSDGLPAKKEDIEESYPLRISWPGILVDDELNPEDIVFRVREALAIIWGEKANAIEIEACEILSCKSLRDYFNNSSKYFSDHLKRFSMSKRRAPLYWPLSTASGSYTLWLYYPRLNDNTLYACLNNFILPKQDWINKEYDRLNQIGKERTKEQEKEHQKIHDLVGEIATFRSDIEKLAKTWKPNLNDGAQITAAPLEKFFSLKSWQKILQDTWKKMESGEYDWAHLSLKLWPERVIQKCTEDLSLAIAHSLRDDLWEEHIDDNGKSKWYPKKNVDNIAQEIINNR